jgi:hypothetical protein
VYLSHELNRRLEALKREAREKSGRFVSKSELVGKILEEFFERES